MVAIDKKIKKISIFYGQKSGYMVKKGKKGKKEEIEKSDKTMTNKKPTKVEIEPQVK